MLFLYFLPFKTHGIFHLPGGAQVLCALFFFSSYSDKKSTLLSLAQYYIPEEVQLERIRCKFL